MERRRVARRIMALAVGVGLGFATDQVVNTNISESAVRQEVPAAVLPKEVVLFAPPKRLKK